MTKFVGAYEQRESSLQDFKDMRLLRLAQVRQQEKLISSGRCDAYRKLIGDRKDRKRDNIKELLLNEKRIERDRLAVFSQSTLVDTGYGHRTAIQMSAAKKIYKNEMESQIIQMNIAAIKRGKEAAIIRNQHIMSNHQLSYDKLEKDSLRTIIKASDREDARDAGEARAAKIARKEVVENIRLAQITQNRSLNVKRLTRQSAVSIQDRSLVRRETSVVRYDTNDNHNVYQPSHHNNAEQAERKALIKQYSTVMKEMLHRKMTDHRAFLARKTISSTRQAVILEAELLLLAAADKSAYRVYRARNKASVRASFDDDLNLRAFEKDFMTKSDPTTNTHSFQINGHSHSPTSSSQNTDNDDDSTQRDSVISKPTSWTSIHNDIATTTTTATTKNNNTTNTNTNNMRSSMQHEPTLPPGVWSVPYDDIEMLGGKMVLEIMTHNISIKDNNNTDENHQYIYNNTNNNNDNNNNNFKNNTHSSNTIKNDNANDNNSDYNNKYNNDRNRNHENILVKDSVTPSPISPKNEINQQKIPFELPDLIIDVSEHSSQSDKDSIFNFEDDTKDSRNKKSKNNKNKNNNMSVNMSSTEELNMSTSTAATLSARHDKESHSVPLPVPPSQPTSQPASQSSLVPLSSSLPLSVPLTSNMSTQEFTHDVRGVRTAHTIADEIIANQLEKEKKEVKENSYFLADTSTSTSSSSSSSSRGRNIAEDSEGGVDNIYIEDVSHSNKHHRNHNKMKEEKEEEENDDDYSEENQSSDYSDKDKDLFGVTVKLLRQSDTNTGGGLHRVHSYTSHNRNDQTNCNNNGNNDNSNDNDNDVSMESFEAVFDEEEEEGRDTPLNIRHSSSLALGNDRYKTNNNNNNTNRAGEGGGGGKSSGGRRGKWLEENDSTPTSQEDETNDSENEEEGDGESESDNMSAITWPDVNIRREKEKEIESMKEFSRHMHSEYNKETNRSSQAYNQPERTEKSEATEGGRWGEGVGNDVTASMVASRGSKELWRIPEGGCDMHSHTNNTSNARRNGDVIIASYQSNLSNNSNNKKNDNNNDYRNDIRNNGMNQGHSQFQSQGHNQGHSQGQSVVRQSYQSHQSHQSHHSHLSRNTEMDSFDENGLLHELDALSVSWARRKKMIEEEQGRGGKR